MPIANEYDLVAHEWHQTGHIVHPIKFTSVSRPTRILAHVSALEALCDYALYKSTFLLFFTHVKK